MKELNIYQRIAEIQGELKAVPESGHHGQGWNYSTHRDIVDALRPLLHKHGVAVTFTSGDEVIQQDDNTLVKTIWRFFNVDKPEEFIEMVVWGEGWDKQDKGLYKAYTGAKKYGLRNFFLISTGDDINPEDPTDTEKKGNKRQVATKKPECPNVSNVPKLPSFSKLMTEIGGMDNKRMLDFESWWAENSQYYNDQQIQDIGKSMYARRKILDYGTENPPATAKADDKGESIPNSEENATANATDAENSDLFATSGFHEEIPEANEARLKEIGEVVSRMKSSDPTRVTLVQAIAKRRGELNKKGK